MNAAIAPIAHPPRVSDARIRLECVRELYKQIPNSFIAAMVVTVYMVATQWDKAPPRAIGWWLATQALAQAHRFWVYGAYRRAEARGAIDIDSADRWARHYAAYMLGAGLVWASCAYWFLVPGNAYAQALTMCGLYGISAGAVPGNAYHPPAIHGFLAVIFLGVFARLLAIGDFDHVALGLASLLFMAIMMLFGRVQTRFLRESIRMRFERAELVEALSRQTREAEQARERAEQSNLAKSQFLAAASHDLRQPLHALGLFSASLRDFKLSEDQQRVVARIYANIDALEALFDELLDISRLDAGTVRPTIVDLRAEPLLQGLAQRYRPLAEARGLSLRCRVPADAVLRADAVLLERMLGNLLANAVRYTERGGIALTCRRRGDAWLLQVWDTGIGIAADQHARIFEEFYQIGNPERDRAKGLGLGLSIVQRLGALLALPISLRSQPGHGSQFALRVPRGDAEAIVTPAPEPASSTADLITGRVIAVIDDEESIREGMAGLLAQWGVRAVVAADLADCEAGLARLGAAPALVIADFRLRDVSGTSVIDALRARHGAGVRGLIITGDVARESLQAARRAGYPVLHKPVRPAQLRALCNHLLAEP